MSDIKFLSSLGGGEHKCAVYRGGGRTYVARLEVVDGEESKRKEYF